MNDQQAPTDWGLVLFLVFTLVAAGMLAVAYLGVWVQSYWILPGLVALFFLGVSLIGRKE